MEGFPSGAWQFTRGNPVNWASDLNCVHPSRGLNSARNLIFEIRQHFDALNRVPMTEDDYDSDEEAQGFEELASTTMSPPPVPVKARRSKASAKAPELETIENDPSVRILLFCYIYPD